MNRSLLPLVLALALSACATPRYLSVADAQARIAPYDVTAVEWALSDVKYWRDYDEAKDDWRPCDETLKLGFGDCDDYAVCAADLVGRWEGCSSRVVVVEGRNARHAITTLSCPPSSSLLHGGVEGYFDNGVWMKGSAEDFGKKILAVRIGTFLLPAYDWKDLKIGEEK